MWAPTLNVLFLLGPPKLAEGQGKDQARSSPELGYELEFNNRVPRNAAVAAQLGQCLGKKHDKQVWQSFACVLSDLLWHRNCAYYHKKIPLGTGWQAAWSVGPPTKAQSAQCFCAGGSGWVTD